MGKASRGKWERRAAAGTLDQMKKQKVLVYDTPKHVQIILTCPRKCAGKHPKNEIIE